VQAQHRLKGMDKISLSWSDLSNVYDIESQVNGDRTRMYLNMSNYDIDPKSWITDRKDGHAQLIRPLSIQISQQRE
jgi:hypothetical protein